MLASMPLTILAGTTSSRLPALTPSQVVPSAFNARLVELSQLQECQQPCAHRGRLHLLPSHEVYFVYRALNLSPLHSTLKYSVQLTLRQGKPATRQLNVCLQDDAQFFHVFASDGSLLATVRNHSTLSLQHHVFLTHHETNVHEQSFRRSPSH